MDSQVTELKKGEIMVLFKRSTAGPAYSGLMPQEGMEVHVWRPWHIMQNIPSASCPPVADLDSTPSTDSVLMCTRFFVPHEPRSAH